MKLNLKDFDIKQFMLKHGEWVGLGVAAAIMLPAFVIGAMNVATSGSARANADDINKMAVAADNKIVQSNPPPDADKADAFKALVVRMDLVESQKYQTANDWFIQSSFEDSKRRAPLVLPPGDFQAVTFRGGMLGRMFRETNNGLLQAWVLREKQRDLSPRELRERKRIQNILKSRGAGGMGMGMPGMGGMGMGMPGMGGMGMGMPGKGGGMPNERGQSGGMGMPGGGEGMMGNRPGAGMPSNMVKRLELMDVDKITNDQSVHFAEDLYPVRMAVVTGTIPFKQQLESFRIALRKRNLNELMSMLDTPEAEFRFAGLEIDRRDLYPDGREKSPWRRYDEEMRTRWKWYLARAMDTEKEDPELSKFWGLQNRGGLIWARPVLVLPYKANDEESRYPKIEIPSLKQAIVELEKKGTENAPKVANKWAEKIRLKFDPENDDLGANAEDENKMDQPDTGTKAPEAEDKNKTGEEEPLVPEKALVRFLDMTVEPGFVYEYRVRVKMHNPNYNKPKEVAYPALAKNKFIVGENSEVIRVAVPWETDWYVMDDHPTPDRLTIQVQRWLGVTTPDPNTDQNYVKVADWCLDDRAMASRGEYIGRPDLVQVPTWNTEKEDWELARHPKRGGQKLQIDFTVRTNQQFPALLIDYDGGAGRDVRFNGRPVTDTAPVQVLVLTPEGKLEIRTNVEDKEKAERKERFDDWKKRLEAVKNPNKKKKEQNLFDRSGPSN
jgi:hypothetical protein